jgi:hypothetical protein
MLRDIVVCFSLLFGLHFWWYATHTILSSLGAMSAWIASSGCRWAACSALLQTYLAFLPLGLQLVFRGGFDTVYLF